jgi:hypothetical protein
MPFVPDSTQAGFLGPVTDTLEGIAWENFLQELVAGITGLDPALVRPRWQPVPPTTPNVSVDWVGCGITATEADWQPYMEHRDEGIDILRRHENVTYSCSFYGPHSADLAAILRDGILVEQNRAVLRVNAVGLTEVTEVRRATELFREQFRDRHDLNILLKREVRRTYNVRNLSRAIGTITATDFADRTLESGFDTGDVETP